MDFRDKLIGMEHVLAQKNRELQEKETMISGLREKIHLLNYKNQDTSERTIFSSLGKI